MNRFGLLFLLSIVVVTSHAETELFTNVITVSTVVKPIETRHAIEININGIGPAVDRMDDSCFVSSAVNVAVPDASVNDASRNHTSLVVCR